jgi:hypothetical protein
MMMKDIHSEAVPKGSFHFHLDNDFRLALI